MALVARLDRNPTETATATNTPVFPPTWTARPSSTPSETPTPSATPTELIIPNTGYDFSKAYIDNVVHLPEGGGRTMVTIVVPGVLDGKFYAEVLIGADSWNYECVVLKGSEDHLFCFGDRLPGTDEALILVYEELEETGKLVLVYEAEFEVAEFVPTKTNTPRSPNPTAQNTSTPTTSTTQLPTTTSTPAPTNTPSPTATFTPGPPPSPQATPITPTPIS